MPRHNWQSDLRAREAEAAGDDVPLVSQVAAVLGRATLLPAERLQLARIQAATGLDAIRAGDVAAAKAFFVDALHHLDLAEERL